MRCILDKDGYPIIVDYKAEYQMIVDYIQSDIQGDVIFIDELFLHIEEVQNKKITSWVGTGNAYTISVYKDEIRIFNEHTEQEFITHDLSLVIESVILWRKFLLVNRG